MKSEKKIETVRTLSLITILVATFILSVWLVFFTPTPSWGASYNFYFNNTEQGDNGTASPSVIVKDGKLIKGEEGDEDSDLNDMEDSENISEDAEEYNALERDANLDDDDYKIVKDYSTTPPPPVGTQTETVKKQSRKTYLRLLAETYVFKARYNVTRDKNIFDSTWEFGGDNTYTYPTSYHNAGFSLTGTLFFNQYIGASLFLGSFSGLELEASPWGVDNDLSLGFMAGVGTFGSGFADGERSEALPYLGARLGMSFSKNWALTASVKGTPYVENTESSRVGKYMVGVGAGVSLYF